MELEFHEYDGSTTALNPRIERRGELLTLKLNEQNCDYFLVLAKAPGGRVDLHDAAIQDALVEKAHLFPQVRDVGLTDDIIVSCIEWSEYRVNDYAVDLPNRIAEYTVAGCRGENGRLLVFMPGEEISCTASVSITVAYRITPISGKEPRGLFAKGKPRQIFYEVEFDDIPSYQDGSIVYTFDGVRWSYPITKEMLEKRKFYIEAGLGTPVFSAAVSGIELQQL